jgi:hypothetical protein
MAPKIVTNEILDLKLDSVKERLSEHIDDEAKVFNDIFRMVEKTEAKLESIDITLAEQHVVLKDHIRRTEALEAALAPIKAKSDVLTVLLKVAGGVGALGAGGFGIKELLLLLTS